MQRLVRVVADKRPARRGVSRPSLPWISELPTSLVRETLAKAVRWVVIINDDEKPAHPPDWCIAVEEFFARRAIRRFAAGAQG
jgi:hypothetical protein